VPLDSTTEDRVVFAERVWAFVVAKDAMLLGNRGPFVHVPSGASVQAINRLVEESALGVREDVVSCAVEQPVPLDLCFAIEMQATGLTLVLAGVAVWVGGLFVLAALADHFSPPFFVDTDTIRHVSSGT
jgi:hypothetical protein